MLDKFDIRFGKVCEVRPFSDKPDSPRRKYCIIKIEFPELGLVKQSIGQFAHHKCDMLDEWVLCLINLDAKNMFGQTSELLILGVPHPKGGVILGDKHEAQATFLQPLFPLKQMVAEDLKPKPVMTFDSWLRADILLGEIIDQSPVFLKMQVAEEVWTVLLSGPLSSGLIGQQLIVARDHTRSLHGILPQTAAGEPILARPRERIEKSGAKVY